MTELNVRNCGDCPFVVRCEEHLQKLVDAKDAVSRAAVDDIVDNAVAPALLEALQSMPDFADQVMPNVENEQDVAAAIRMGAASVLERMDEQEESITAIANLGTLACNGPLKMRAGKDHVTTTATICCNPMLPPGTQIEDVVVNRRPS